MYISIFICEPITTIQVKEFIVGKVGISNNVKITQFYQVKLFHDGHSIHFNC